jgi:hypothetical protein
MNNLCNIQNVHPILLQIIVYIQQILLSFLIILSSSQDQFPAQPMSISSSSSYPDTVNLTFKNAPFVLFLVIFSSNQSCYMMKIMSLKCYIQLKTSDRYQHQRVVRGNQSSLQHTYRFLCIKIKSSISNFLCISKCPWSTIAFRFSIPAVAGLRMITLRISS